MSGIDKCYFFPLITFVRFRKNVLNFPFNEVLYWKRIVRYMLYFQYHVVSATCNQTQVCVCVCVYAYNIIIIVMSIVPDAVKFRPNRVIYDNGKKADSAELVAKQIFCPWFITVER